MNENKRQEKQRLEIRVNPKAGRSEITGWKDGALRVKVAAPPEKGKGNKELVDLLSRVLEIKKSAITIVAGRTGRNKTIAIEELSREEIINKIQEAITKRQ